MSFCYPIFFGEGRVRLELWKGNFFLDFIGLFDFLEGILLGTFCYAYGLFCWFLVRFCR